MTLLPLIVFSESILEKLEQASVDYAKFTNQ